MIYVACLPVMNPRESASSPVVPSPWSFELPILIYILASLSILSAKFMRNTRRYAIVIILIIAAIITPTPDAITMGVVAVPLLFLYEIGIWVAVGVEKRRAKRDLLASQS